MTETAYSLPQVYELAFNFRDYSKAVDFLIEAAAPAGLEKIDSMVELGCGPGQYCREFAARGVRSLGIDRSPEMVACANGKCREGKLPCEIIEADMRSFQLPQKVDLACCMMSTFHLLLTNRDVIEHFNAVADNLTSGGVYIIEMTHPRDFFDKGDSSAKNEWTMKDEYLEVHTDWGSDGVTDPITEIVTGTVIYTVKRPTATERHEYREQWREIPAGLIRALVELSGRFAIAGWYGDLDMQVPFDNDKKAWRMVLVLRKI